MHGGGGVLRPHSLGFVAVELDPRGGKDLRCLQGQGGCAFHEEALFRPGAGDVSRVLYFTLRLKSVEREGL